MIAGEHILGLILARGGSKGLPGKNIRSLLGKPLIVWTIEAGKRSIIDDLVLSTDCNEIARCALKHGVEVPFMRPPRLASDNASSMETIIHALDKLEEIGKFYEYIVLLEPTSPLRESDDIDQALEMLVKSDAKSIVSICHTEEAHPSFLFKISNERRLNPYLGIYPNGIRRQEIEPLYFLEGTIYASEVKTLRNRFSFYHEDTIGYEVPKWKSPEVDDEIDFLLIESIMKSRNIL